MKYKYNYDISGGVRFLVSKVSKEKKCPNAPIWINRSSIRGAVFFNLKWRLIFIKWINWRFKSEQKYSEQNLNFWNLFWIFWFWKKQEIYEMSARTPPGRFSIDFLLSKGNIFITCPEIPPVRVTRLGWDSIMGK